MQGNCDFNGYGIFGKAKGELNQIREDLEDRLADFEAKQGQDLSEEKLKEYKDTAKRWVEMDPK